MAALNDADQDECPGSEKVLLYQQGFTNEDEYGAYGEGDTNLLAVVTFEPDSFEVVSVDCR